MQSNSEEFACDFLIILLCKYKPTYTDTYYSLYTLYLNYATLADYSLYWILCRKLTANGNVINNSNYIQLYSMESKLL